MKIPSDQRRQLCMELMVYQKSHPEQANVAKKILTFINETPDCFCRSHTAGHITGSAWLINPDHTKALLTLHRKLGRWLQPGGHADGCSNTLETALREATEESGITGIIPMRYEIFDVDIHRIPASPSTNTPAHLHYDIRYLLKAPHETFRLSPESIALAWWTAHDFVVRKNEIDEAVLRLSRLWTQEQGLASQAF